MTIYAKNIGGVVVRCTDGKLRKEYPTVAFPNPMTDAVRERYGMYPVIEVSPPSYDPSYQIIVESFTGTGPFTQVWTVVSTGTTDGELREARYAENAAYAKSLIVTAELTPEQGVTLNERQRNKVNERRSNKSRQNKQQKVSDADDYLYDYIDTVYDALDLADDAVEAADRITLENWDAATAVTWPVWTPYVAP